MNYAPFEAEVPKVNDLLCAGSSAGAPILIRTVALRYTFARTARPKELEGRLARRRRQSMERSDRSRQVSPFEAALWCAHQAASRLALFGLAGRIDISSAGHDEFL
jgi:hypothetical protein